MLGWGGKLCFFFNALSLLFFVSRYRGRAQKKIANLRKADFVAELLAQAETLGAETIIAMFCRRHELN